LGSFFLLHASEDYVEMAKAKGLSSRMIERRYILRPALPNVVTSFALLLISFWQGAIVLEVFFNWPGIGKLSIEAVRAGAVCRPDCGDARSPQGYLRTAGQRVRI
jgi:peptide/nickel transport system permease protein